MGRFGRGNCCSPATKAEDRCFCTISCLILTIIGFFLNDQPVLEKQSNHWKTAKVRVCDAVGLRGAYASLNKVNIQLLDNMGENR